LVNNGAYEVKVDSVGSTGSVTSVSQNISVNRKMSTATVNIYNSVGEIVRHLYSLTDNPSGSTMTDVSLSTKVMSPSLTTSGSNPNSVQILILASGSPVTLSWDGTADSGGLVTPGVYQIEVSWSDGQGGNTNVSRGVMVLGGPGAEALVVKPNVLNGANGMVATFDASNVTNAYTLKASIYAVSGELITTIQGTSGTKMVSWDATGVASSVYIAVVSIQNANGGTISTQRSKILVLR
jgi:flagellar hook assembly protein FlgD